MRQIELNHPEPLHSVEATRAIERDVAEKLPAHTLMTRAGRAVSSLSQALAPHAKTIWIACGPGNNGGDGLAAAKLLAQQSVQLGLRREICVTMAGDRGALPADASHALNAALDCGLHIAEHPPAAFDLAIDALLGIGAARPPSGTLAEHLAALQQSESPVLCVDVPSGLMADTGTWMGDVQNPGDRRHTLSLLTLKPGLFTAHGRDAAGTVWFDDLGAGPDHRATPSALLSAFTGLAGQNRKTHASHKGSHGEVVVVGGQSMEGAGSAMVGAAVLAARAAIRSGTGRVYVCLVPSAPTAFPGFDPQQPELMFRSVPSALGGDLLERSVVVCGCGGGQSIAPMLAPLLSRSRALVIDADALNAIAGDPQLQTLVKRRHQRGWTTVITPHPLEAARLLGTTTAGVMADRLAASHDLSERLGAICVLKGSGTVITAPGQIPRINASGNGALATAGTGDVLAGMIGAALATTEAQMPPLLSTARAVHHHGWLADRWVLRDGAQALTADQLTL